MVLKHKQRVFILQIFFILIFVLFWIHIFNLQVCKSSGIILQAKKQLLNKTTFLRGDIRDRNGNLLVLDLITYELYNNVRNYNKIPEEKILKLVNLLNINIETLKDKLKQKINSKIFSGINENLADKIRNLNADFVYIMPRVTRVYPHKKMASHIIGFVNKDHKGQHGVEYYHENLLIKPYENMSTQQIFQKGTSIVLTIDSVLQEYAEDALNKAILQTKAPKGTIIVLSPKSGEVFAWAVYPSFDPNNYFKEKYIKNWSITDIYEPGSTFKVITVSSALENMTIEKNSSFYDSGFLKVEKRIIRNHHKNKPQQISLLELFKQSSNVAAAQVALSMKPEMFYSSIKNIMIGRKTNIDLPGESEGLLLNPKEWKPLDLATTAFGQGAVSITPIQLACALSAIANHGIWVQPHLLKGTWEPNYELINESPYNILKEQALSQEVADFVSSLLRKSVKENLKAMTYIAGEVPGYEVAGKTGTAQKIRTDGKGYLGGHTVASFIGYIPADDPEILTLVVIDDPKTAGGWGNTVCGPIFNKVTKMAAKRIIENS